MPIVLKSGSLNLLESSGPVQACNGIALPLPAIRRIGVYDNTTTINPKSVLYSQEKTEFRNGLSLCRYYALQTSLLCDRFIVIIPLYT